MNSTQFFALSILCCAGALSAAIAAEVRPSAADDQMHATAITAAIARAAPAKDAVATYRVHHDGFPASNLEAGMPPAASFATSAVKSVEIGKDGAVVATLTADSGVDDGTVVFVPSMSPTSDTNNVEWTCSSPSYSNISDVTAGVCVYSKNR